MVYFTGDTHGSAFEVVRFCKRFNLTADDTIVILGDVGANFCLDERDTAMKSALQRLKPTILCIHGNHEIRPANIPSYITKDWNGGTAEARFLRRIRDDACRIFGTTLSPDYNAVHYDHLHLEATDTRFCR